MNVNLKHCTLIVFGKFLLKKYIIFRNIKSVITKELKRTIYSLSARLCFKTAVILCKLFGNTYTIAAL